MDVEMEMEMDVDIQMSDDELEKELKELEKENKVKNEREVKLKEEDESRQKDIETNIPDEPVSGKRSRNDKRRHGKDKVSLKTFYDDVESGSHHENIHNSKRPFDIYQERGIDYRRLNRGLHISKQCDPMVVGREVAYRLHEPKTLLFGHVVRILGQNMVSEIFAETKDIVNSGGLKTDNGDRMRSPGGTFLYIMKNRCYATPEQVKEIFREDNEARKQARKRLKQQNFIQQDHDVNSEIKSEIKSEIESEVKGEIKNEVKNEAKSEVKSEVKNEVIDEKVKREIKNEIKSEVKNEDIEDDQDTSKEVTTCSEMKLTSSCVLGNLGDKGFKTKELLNTIAIDKNIKIKEDVEDKDNESTNTNNIKDDELEEGEVR